MSLNRAVLLGRLGKDPELRYTQAGTPVASFSLAVERNRKPEGSDKYPVDWIDFVAWRATAEFVSKYFSKGSKMAVEGRIQVRSWVDKEGNKRKAVEVVVDNVDFADDKKSNGVHSKSYGDDDAPPQYPGASGLHELDDDDDGELPF
jgi:single-strand DNA-binding protein